MNKLKISVLDVGHGDFISITSPYGEELIIDCGSSDSIGGIKPHKFLEDMPTLHELQISHPHTDHFDDIIKLASKNILSFRCPRLDNFENNTIGWKKSDKEKLEKLKELKKLIGSDDSAVPNERAKFGHTVWSSEKIDSKNPNSASLVTIIYYGSFKMLFGGDLHKEGWEELLKNPRFVRAIKGTTVFKVSHHGRESGCSEKLMEMLKPDLRLCIISDKSLEKDNENTSNTQWYTDRIKKGRRFNGVERKVLTTRNDGSIHIQADCEETWNIYTQTPWKND
jgi:beta-lactamase superfamily II metal-dependent hydrolase